MPRRRTPRPLAQTALSWLEVFVTGLGEENCKQDDIECLKRQKVGGAIGEPEICRERESRGNLGL
jgi:hypothetical protein